MNLPPRILKEMAHAAGFDLVAFGPADLGQHSAHFAAWLDAGRAGEMDYLERNRENIQDPQRWAPASRSSISLAYDYGGPEVQLQGGGRIARYAVGRDYHRFLGKACKRIRKQLEAEGVPRGQIKTGTDAAPVLERALAARAGIGFLAKSAGIINPSLGPYLLLSELLTPLELEPDPIAPGSCGSCTACLDACPTQAIVAPHQVDARRCLSYTTIEQRGFIAEDLRRAQADWFFGCDICLEVCPFTSKGRAALPSSAERPADLQPHQAVQSYQLVGILSLSEAAYQSDWLGTAMRRATRSGLRRNAAIVLGNLKDEAAIPALATALQDADPVVRGHAAWALGEMSPRHPALAAQIQREEDPRVMAEIHSIWDR